LRVVGVLATRNCLQCSAVQQMAARQLALKLSKQLAGHVAIDGNPG